MELQETFLKGMQEALEANPAVKAAWLSGSLGRGIADRYSDIDLNIWLDTADLGDFRHATQPTLERIRPLVLFRWMFNDRMANALTADGLRLDLWLHTDTPKLDPERVRVLLDREQALQFETSTIKSDAAGLQQRLVDQIREFWRCIAMTPAVMGREERLVMLFGLSIEINILTDVLIAGYGIERDSGVKRLNPFLPADLRAEIEAAVTFDGLTTHSLANAHLALARIMQREGRQLATRHGFAYPVETETAALNYVKQELAALGMVVESAEI